MLQKHLKNKSYLACEYSEKEEAPRIATRYMPGQMFLGRVAAKYEALFSALMRVRQVVSCHLRYPETTGTIPKMTIILKMPPTDVSRAY